jgi:coproporphyrinogen III oxidase
MANVKITALTHLGSADVSVDDVFIIDDVSVPESKKITVANLRLAVDTIATSNINTVQDNVTANFNQLDANISVVQDNVTANFNQLDANINVVQDNVAANFTQLDANISVVQDNVAAAEANVGLVRSNLDSFASTSNSNAAALAAGIAGTSVDLTVAADSGTNDVVVVGTDTFTFAGGTGLTSTVSDNQIQFDIDDTAVTAGVYGGKIGTVSNVPVLTIDAQGRITAASNVEVAVDLSTLESNVNTVSSNVSALDVQVNANLDAVQDNVTANFNQLDANINVVQDNVTANFNQLDANINVVQDNVAANFTQLDSNINVVQDNVASIIDGTTAFTGDVTFEDTTDDSAAGPEFNLFRNSATPANGDYLGQIKFQGKSDGGTTRLYSKITGKVSSVTNGNETGLIEVAVRDSGSNKITTRFKGDEIQTLNGVGLDIDGTSTFADQVTMSDDLIVSGNLTINGDQTVINTTNMEVDDTLIMLANGTTGAPANDVGILFNRGNQGNAAFFYDESAQTFKVSDTLDPSSNTSLSPVTSANLDVGILTAATIKFDGADLNTAITDNVALLDTQANASATFIQLNSNINVVQDNVAANFTQLDANINVVSSNSAAVEARRVANIAGAVSTITTGDLTASRALVSDGSGKIAVSAITSTELGFLDGLDQNLNANLVALAAGIVGAAAPAFPTGDYGLLDSANAATDAFGETTSDLDTFDMKTAPSGELATEDLGVLT